MIAALLAASISFTATATGVGKGTPLEFAFAGSDSDRAYETMFLLEEPVADFCRRLERAGLPRGRPVAAAACRLWPVGCAISFEPSLDRYVKTTLPDGVAAAPPIYTGGSRTQDGAPLAATEMPSAVFSLYTLSQAPIVFNGIYEQGVVYGCHLAAVELKKGEKVKFTVTWDEKSLPRHIDVTVAETNATAVLAALRSEAANGETDVMAAFDPMMTVASAKAAATALSLVDSPRIKLNGYADGGLFYRAFTPEPEWTNRQARLVQPFELTIGEDSERLVFIDEDWNVEGDDPKLTLKEIPFSDAAKYPKTDTCFIFARPDCRLERIFKVMSRLKASKVTKWYVFSAQ